jgi:hypothetical protein
MDELRPGAATEPDVYGSADIGLAPLEALVAKPAAPGMGRRVLHQATVQLSPAFSGVRCGEAGAADFNAESV